MKPTSKLLLNFLKEKATEYPFLNDAINIKGIESFSIEEILDLFNTNEKDATTFHIFFKNEFMSKKSTPENTIILENQFKKLINSITKVNEAKNTTSKLFYTNLIKISSLGIRNFRLFQELTINFAKNTTIILGKNGFGKTSILQALTLSILPDESKDLKPIDFEPYIRINENKANFKLSWHNSTLTRNTTFSTTKKNTSSNFYNSTEFEEDFLPDMIYLTYGTNTFTEYERTDYSQISKDLISGDGKWYEISSIFKDYTNSFFDPLRIFNDLDYFERNNIENKQAEIKEIKETILKKLNYLIPNFNIEKENETGLSYYFYQENTEKRYKLITHQLSEGYKSTIVLLTDILVRIMAARNIFDNIKGQTITKKTLNKFIDNIENNDIEKFKISEVYKNAYGILAIDEFDRHLHPTWQQNYIQKLRKVFPKLQFVLTTHNPLSILDREEDEVIELDYKEDTKKLTTRTYKGGTKDMDIVLVLLKYFGVDSVVSNSFKEKTDEYYRLLANNEETERFFELQKELRKSHIGVTIPDYEYLKFREFVVKNEIDLRKLEKENKLNFADKQWQELADEFI